MAVTVRRVVTHQFDGTSGSVDVTVAAGDALLVFVGLLQDASQSVTGITWNTTEALSSVTSLNQIFAYVLTTPTAGTHAVAVTLSAEDAACVAAYVLTGVRSTTPAAIAGGSAGNGIVCTSGSLTVPAWGLLANMVVVSTNVSGSLRVTATGQTQQGVWAQGTEITGGASSRTTTGAMAWAWTGIRAFSHLAVNVYAAPVSGRLKLMKR